MQKRAESDAGNNVMNLGSSADLIYQVAILRNHQTAVADLAESM